MKFYILSIVVVMFSLITWTYQNLEYKGYKRVQGCTGECYEEYVRIHGSVVEQLQAKQEEAAADPFSSIRGLAVLLVTGKTVKEWEHFQNLQGAMPNTSLRGYMLIKVEKP